MKITKEIAECVGLWLAEGDNKTKAEITFTNNCLELILFFQRVIRKIYAGNNKPRLYVYSPTERQLFYDLKGYKKINFYRDTRATKTYYIYRLADTKFVKFWKRLVEETKREPRFYAEILRGFFAGEGNVHHNQKANNSRSIRISCKTRIELIEKISKYFQIKYRYDISHRNGYVISGPSLNKLNEIKIACLHPEKASKFYNMINSIREEHYSPNYLKEAIYSKLSKLYTTQQLAEYFKRRFVYVQEILSKLKRENKTNNIKIKNKSLWARNEVIERFLINRRLGLLKGLDTFKTINELSKNINLGIKTIRRRLRILEKENLVENKNRKWKLSEKGKQLICGIDESGSKSLDF